MHEQTAGGFARFMPRGPLWRHPDFMRLWAAQIFSAFGARITRTALPFIAILTLNATPSELAILSVLGFGPGLVVGLFAGGVVDRSRKRRLMVGADLVRAAVILTLPAAAWSGWLSMPQLYLTAACVGAASALFDIADRSFLPRIVRDDELVDANAKLQASEAIAEAAGPGAAGVLIQALTAPVAVIFDAATYLWSAFMLGRIRAEDAPAAACEEKPHVLRDIAIGFRAVLSDPLVRPCFLADSVVWLSHGFFSTLYLIVMLRTAHLSPAMAGIIIGLGGIGAFFGSLVAQPLGRWLGMGAALTIAFTLACVTQFLVPLAAAVPAYAIACFVTQQLLGDGLSVIYAIHATSLRQRVLPAETLGRANAAFQASGGLLLPVGALIAGPLTEQIGVPLAALIGTLIMLAATPLIVFSRLPKER